MRLEGNMRISWRKQVKKIPNRVQIAPKVFYDVVWQKELTDTKGSPLYGVTDLSNKIITICMDMPAKVTVETYWHEITHAWSEEFKINLTENQVLNLEHILPYLLKYNNVWKEE